MKRRLSQTNKESRGMRRKELCQAVHTIAPKNISAIAS
jgi:hypothetical protein